MNDTSKNIKVESGLSIFKEDSTIKCLVCDENEAGKHYGSICCSGCKGFFRRTVRFGKNYTCPYTNQCIIRKEYRNCCRACRYQKCLECGLNPMLVHGDRGISSKYGKQTLSDLPDYVDDPCASNRTKNFLAIKGGNKKHTKNELLKSNAFGLDESAVENIIIACKFLSRDENLPLGLLKIIPPFDPTDFASISKYYVLVEKLCDTYVDSELSHMSLEFEDKCSINVSQTIAINEPRKISQRSYIDWEPRFYITSKLFRRVWCRVAGQYFDWASHIPELQEFDEHDRELLLIARCIPSVWLQMGRKSFLNNTNGIDLSGGSYFPADPKEWNKVDKDLTMLMSHLSEVMLNEFIMPMKELQVTEPEYTLLRVICFCMPVSGLSEAGLCKINKIKSKYVDTLTELVYRTCSHLPLTRALQRITKIMLLLPVIEKVAQMEDDTMSLMTLFNIAYMRGTLPYDIHELLKIGRFVPSFLIQHSYRSAVLKAPGFVLTGGSYFPRDPLEWPNVDATIVSIMSNVMPIIRNNLIDVFRGIKISESEYVLLRMVSFFMPVSQLSSDGLKTLHSVKNKYVEVFNATVYYSNPNLSSGEVMRRVSKLINLLFVVERAARICDDIMSVATLFNWAEMRGSLPYDVYIRKNDQPTAHVAKFVQN